MKRETQKPASSMERQQWLEAAAIELRSLFATAGYTLDLDRCRVSIGFPKGRHGRKTIGQCFSPKVSADTVAETFVSPVLSDSAEILGVMIHEYCHAIVGTEAGHKGPFRKLALAMGLMGKMTATQNGPELLERLNGIIAHIGPYPAGQINLQDAVRKQSTRLLKCWCDQCGYTVRITRKWLEASGAPICPTDTLDMVCE